LDKADKSIRRVVASRRLCLSSADSLFQFEDSPVQLEEEKAALAADLREVYAEAKGNGFDVKALRAVVRLRKQDENKRREEEAVLVTYLHALGMAEETVEADAA
jgi:uncharacterized protein (UPF0335 family)